MKSFRSAAFLAAGFATLCAAAARAPAVAEVMEAVCAALPRVPLRAVGQLQAKGPRGNLEATWNVEIRLDLGASPAQAAYTLSDAFGRPEQRLVVRWPANGPPRYEFFAGPDLRRAPSPDPLAPLGGMDFSWADLSLDFLHWRDGAWRGRETYRGRPCHVLDLHPPAGAEGRAASVSTVRVWVDQELNVLLRAEAFDDQGRLQRRLRVRSFKRVRDVWTILDVEVQSFPSRHKTLLRVREVSEES